MAVPAVSSVEFRSQFARRIPDPVFRDQGVERHILFVNAREVPKGLPDSPNARVPNIRRTVYKEVRESLLSGDGKFHLKHKGITLIASSVTKKGDSQVYTVTFDKDQGLVDGGHSYQLLTLDDLQKDIPENQFVKFEILTDVPSAWNADIAGGLNTSVQVQDMSLDNLKGDFDWLKKILKKEKYYSKIAWRENEDGDVDARDLVSLLLMFNVHLFKNDLGAGDTQPVIAYEKKSAALKMYEQDMRDGGTKSFKKLAPIVRDIFTLHDVIGSDARYQWNESGGSFGNLSFVETRQTGFVMTFTGAQVDYRLMSGALFPMLAAFRWMVEEKKGEFAWRGGFDAVIRMWKKSALEMLQMTKQANDELGRNANAIGKSRNHWANLVARVAMRDLMTRTK
jgi:AIPR protein